MDHTGMNKPLSILCLACTITLVSSQAIWRPPPQAKINTPGEPTYIQTPGDGSYNHSWYIVADRRQMVFEVKACSGALLAFAAYQGNQEKPILELALGVEDNTKLEFRSPGSTGAPLFGTYVRDPLHCNEFRTFWVSWYNNDFVLGRGPIANEQTLMNWRGGADLYVNAVGLSSQKGSSAIWKISENSGSYQAMHTFGEHSYTTMWKSVEDRHFWTFSLTASNAHAYILLSERLGGTDSNVYEFAIGVDSPVNDRILLRSEVGGSDATVKAQVRLANVVVGNDLREFWICWYRGQIELGRGSMYGKRRLLLWKDPVPFSVRYLSIATGAQSFGRWLIHDDQESVNYLLTSPLNATASEQLYNQTWIVTPQQEYFVTAVTACQEASIILSQELRAFEGESIEVVIGAMGNSKTLVRYFGQTQSIIEQDTVGILSCTEPKHFWLSWHDRTVRLGRGVIYSLDVILETTLGTSLTWNVGGLGIATRITAGEWRVQESIGERVVVRTPPAFMDFSHYWRSMTQQNYFIFSVRTCSDCHVAMSPTLGVDPGESYYDLVISGYSNQFTLLHEVTGVDRKVLGAEVPTPNLLSCQHHVDLWVGWEGPTIKMGRGSLGGYHVLYTHTFSMEHYPVKAVSVSTGFGNDGDFIYNEDFSDYFMFYTGLHDHVRWVELTSAITWSPLRIRACQQVSVYLCAQQNQQNCYELQFGSFNNTKSSITVRGNSQPVTELDTPDILNCLDTRLFWVRWSNQRLSVGYGTIPDHYEFMFYQDSNPIPVAFIGFESTSEDYYARWQVDKNAVASVSFLTPTTFTYEQMWETVSRRSAAIFGVAACSDVHVLLSNRVRWWNDVFDLFIGGNHNTRSVIRGSQGPDYVGVDTPGILHCTERRYFWVTWVYGAIEVGRGEIVGKDKFMDFQPLELYPVNAIGYSTGYDHNGTWYIKSNPALLPTEPPVTPAPPFTDPPVRGAQGGLSPDQVAGIVLGVLAALLIIAVIAIYIRTGGSNQQMNGVSSSGRPYFTSRSARDTDAIAPDNMAPEQQARDAANL